MKVLLIVSLIYKLLLSSSAVATVIDYDKYYYNAEWIDKKIQLPAANNYRFAKAVSTTVPELIRGNGYTVEIHSVTTKDGYILEMHRIPSTPASPKSHDKPVVFIMHGLLGSSADWVVAGPEKSLAYILADAGYDVWMGNARGNTYSKKHSTITDLRSKKFWDFDWHEIGIYDLPAMIDFALDITRQKKVIYVGHSQGTTSFFVMTSEIPEYNYKIKAMFALAPVAYMGNIHSPLLRLAARAVRTLSFIFKLFGVNEFLPNNGILKSAGETFCHDDDITQTLCSQALFVLCGFNKAQLNTTMLPAIFAHTPAGASTRQIAHYGQEVRSHKFRQFDHGWVKNKFQYYGKWTPPEYDLKKITAPVHLIYSDNDWLADVKDVNRLHNELGNPIEMVRVLDRKWNHLDFLWGINAKRLVYDDILYTLAKRYSH